MLGLKLNHVSKRGPSALAMELLQSCIKPSVYKLCSTEKYPVDEIIPYVYVDILAKQECWFHTAKIGYSMKEISDHKASTKWASCFKRCETRDCC